MFIALCDKPGESFHANNQTWGSLYASNASFKEPSQDMSKSCSCSQVVSPETLSMTNGFLTYSDFKATTPLKQSAKHPSGSWKVY
jgi:hypothetical protein